MTPKHGTDVIQKRNDPAIIDTKTKYQRPDKL